MQSRALLTTQIIPELLLSSPLYTGTNFLPCGAWMRSARSKDAPTRESLCKNATVLLLLSFILSLLLTRSLSSRPSICLWLDEAWQKKLLHSYGKCRGWLFLIPRSLFSDGPEKDCRVYVIRVIYAMLIDLNTFFRELENFQGRVSFSGHKFF